MKNIRMFASAIMVILCSLGAVFGYMTENSLAMNAYITAIFGWLIIATEDVTDFLNKNKVAKQ